MKARYVQRGEAIDFTPSAADVAAGDVVKVGKLVGVSKLDIKKGELGALVLCGVYEMSVKAEDDIAMGDVVYFDTAAGTVTKTYAEGMIPFGVAIGSANSGGMVNVRLTQNMETPETPEPEEEEESAAEGEGGEE